MTTAVVPIPANTPDRTGVRLLRLSGRPALFFYDADKLQGPMFYALTGTFTQLWADSGLYRLRLTPPGGQTTETTVQVGVGDTVEPDRDGYATLGDVTAEVAALRAELGSLYANIGQGETISGAWDFTTEPTVGGQPITSAVSPTQLAAAVTAELTSRNLDSRYARPNADTTIGGHYDFTVAPTIGGVPITSGSDSRLLAQAQAAAAAAAAAQATAQDALTRVQAYIAAGGGTGTPPPPPPKALLSSVRLRVQDDGTTPAGPTGGRFLGDPGNGHAYIGANNGQIPIDQFDSLIFPTAPLHKATLVREYSGSALLFGASTRNDVRAWCLAGRIPFLSHKIGPYTMAQVATGAADADVDNNATFYAGLKTSTGTPAPVFLCFYHEPEDDSVLHNLYTAADYRTAYRRVIARTRAIAPNVSWFSPCLQGFAFRSAAKWDPKSFHPNWNGSAWAYDVLDGDAIDLYNPNVGPVTGDKNQSWANSAGAAFVQKRVAQGWKQLPWLIGEYGFKNDVATLDDGGVTVANILQQTMTTGVGTQQLIGFAVWDNDSFRKNATYDADGSQRAAIKAAMLDARAVIL